LKYLALLALALTGCARNYRVSGLILRTDPAARTILVSHSPIDRYMPAMAMNFHVAPHEDISKLTPGTRVDFDLRVGQRESMARHLKPQIAKLDVPVPAPSNQLAIGAAVPDFELIDQSNRRVRLSDFRGRVVALDFIYTRCPLPDVCPRLSANFSYIARHMRGRDVQLLSITIDPQFDTPPVLTEYAHRYSGDGILWRFLTGSPGEIRSVSGMFGLIYWPEEGSITHTVATAVITRDGLLAAIIEGSKYRPEQLRDLIEQNLQ